MLELNAPNWRLLEDAFGSAEQVPKLLTELKNASKEALDELFGRICHQMSVYSSSIAAFPHLISIAETLEGFPGLQADVLCLAGAICESREFEHELRCSEFAGALCSALPAAIGMAETALCNVVEKNHAIYLLKSVAAFGHMQALARILEGFSSDEFTLVCPSCLNELYVWPCSEGLFVAADDPVTHKNAKRTFVAPKLHTQSKQSSEFQWLERQSLRSNALAEIRCKLPFLFGEATCPKCLYLFALFDELTKQAV